MIFFWKKTPPPPPPQKERSCGQLSRNAFKALIAEGALQFSQHLSDPDFSRKFACLTGTMVSLQKDLKKIMGTWQRVSAAASEFMEIFKAKSALNTKFPQCMELHMLVTFTNELREQGVEVDGPWSSETRTSVYRKI